MEDDVEMAAADNRAAVVLSCSSFSLLISPSIFFQPPFTVFVWDYWNPNLLVIELMLKENVIKQEMDEMKKRLKEMEDESAALLEMQAKVEKEMGSVQGLSPFN